MLNQADTITCNFTATLLQLYPCYFGLIGFIVNGKEKDHLPMNPRKDFPLKTSSYTLSPFCSYKTLTTSYSNHNQELTIKYKTQQMFLDESLYSLDS